MNISRKLIIGTFSILVAAGMLALFVHSRIMIAGEAKDLDSLGNTVGPIVEASLMHSMLKRDAGALNATLASIGRTKPIRQILLVNDKGIVVAGTDPEAAGTKAMSGDPNSRTRHEKESRGAFSGEETFRWVQWVRNRPECHQCHSPETEYVGAVVVDFSSHVLRERVKKHIATEALIFFGSFTFIGFGMLRLSNAVIIRRLNDMHGVVMRFREGCYDVRASVRGKDEICSLGEGFNELAEAVSASQKELQQHADELMALTVSSNVISAVPLTENIYEAVCNLAITELGLKMAWIGVVKEGSKGIEPVVQCGFEAGYLARVRSALDNAPSGGGPTERAVATKSPQVMNDIDATPAFEPWRDEALKRGYRSSMALPLLSSDGDTMGVLNLYSGQSGYFTRKRVRLFMIFANQAAAAFENRSLIENLERKNSEIAAQFREISRSHKEWQLTFDSIADLITIHDPDFRIIRANRAVADFFGMGIESIINKHCHEVFHGTCSPVTNCPHRATLSENRAAVEEVPDPRTGKIFAISTFPYHSAEGKFIGSIHIARDITEAREKEMRLIMSERLAGLGQMSSGIAHEINNPLASIAGCAEGLLLKVRKGAYDAVMFEEYLQIIQEEIFRCKNITMGMLSFVRKSTYEKRDVQINETLDKTIELLGYQGRLRQVTVERDYAADMPSLHGSEGELRQVFLALMTNALDAMNDAGTLAVETSVRGERACVKICDTGPGIPQEDMHRLFDPFFTTKSDRGGTGLGLSIAHKIIANHGGSIDVISGQGKGAIFVITIPLA